MDELANFHFAPPELIPLERRLFEQADLVFTGGYSLYEAKREGRRQVRLWSLDAGVDASTWRTLLNQPQDAPAWQMLRRTGWRPPATVSGEASPSGPSSSSDANNASSTPARQAMPPLGDAGAPS
jgi:hypothetical protein